MNDIETVNSQSILLPAAQFAPIFAKAWYVVINGALYEKIDDYESDDNDEFCTAFSAVECDDIFEISYKYEEESDVLYNRQTGEYEFLSPELKDISAFQILGLIKPDCA